MPTLIVIATWMPDSTNGASKAASIRAATASISAGASRSSQTMTNSSPDMRARVSPGPHRGAESLGHRHQELVPHAVAVEVVDQLQSIEVGEEHRDDRARCGGPGRPRDRAARSAASGWATRSGRRAGPARGSGRTTLGDRLAPARCTGRRRRHQPASGPHPCRRGPSALRCSGTDRARPADSSPWRSGNVNTAASPSSMARGGERREAGLAAQVGDGDRLAACRDAVTHGPSPSSVCSSSKRSAEESDAATYRGGAAGGDQGDPGRRDRQDVHDAHARGDRGCPGSGSRSPSCERTRSSTTTAAARSA